jgi:ABC-type Fe3+ transport system substrate-binding protein
VYPSDGAFSIQRPIAIVKKERNESETDLIHQFIDFAISEDCQKISSRFGFTNVLKESDSLKQMKINEIHPDWEQILANQDEILYFYEENVLD